MAQTRDAGVRSPRTKCKHTQNIGYKSNDSEAPTVSPGQGLRGLDDTHPETSKEYLRLLLPRL